jgi:soluble lytic murein transglycosylase
MRKKIAAQILSSISVAGLAAVILLLPLSAGCSTPQFRTEEEALRQLRQLTKDGQLPAESFVQQIENAFPNTRTAALARLVRARIRLNSNDAAGAATLLDSPIFKQKTTLVDYALWLRGKALFQAARYTESQKVYEQLLKDFPGSLRAKDAKLGAAEAALFGSQPQNVPFIVRDLADANDPAALMLIARSFEQQGNQAQAMGVYRRIYFWAAGTEQAKQAEAKLIPTAAPASLPSPSANALITEAQTLPPLPPQIKPQTIEEAQGRADRLYQVKNYTEAAKAYTEGMLAYPTMSTSANLLRRGNSFAFTRKPAEAATAYAMIPLSAGDIKAEGYYQLARAHANAKNWAAARATIEELRRNFPNNAFAPKALIDVGMIARDANNKLEEAYFLRAAISSYPNALDVAKAQFELAWLEHDRKNFALSSQQMIEHLARYANKDTTYRGRAGYWAARDSERAGKLAEACYLYEAMIPRYDANWYGYLSEQRLNSMKSAGRCNQPANLAKDSLVAKAAANLKTVTVAPEIATAKEDERLTRSDQLSIAGLFDWAIEELKEAAKSAPTSPRVNMATARHYRLKQENTQALLALAKSYPDYSQMEPEEMSAEEWDVFYPLLAWDDIKKWSEARRLDPYKVAGLIRQESVFDPRAKSGANAYGLMQLLIPTARSVARKYNASITDIYAETLYQPAINIELGTAYMRDQLDKYGRLEYMAAAYNAGPGRVVQWQKTLPYEMDEWVEAIPFRETKGYVQGVTRNMLQYRRLYDMNGKFKATVGIRPLRSMIDSTSPATFAQQAPDVKLLETSEDQAAE